MKQHLFVALALTLASASSFAAGRDYVQCNWADKSGTPNRVIIHQDVGGQLVALYSTESFGGSRPTYPYKVEKLPTPPGGGLAYSGKGLTLRIQTDAPGKQGFRSIVTIPDFKVNAQIFCHFMVSKQ